MVLAPDLGPVAARERFFRDGQPVAGAVRSQILSSWQRAQSLGLSPDGCELPFVDDLDLEGRLVRAAAPVLDRLEAHFAGRNMNVALADARGAVLERRFGEASLARKLPPIQSLPGFVFAEEYAGTNGIGLALSERRQINVYGAEHFAERSQSNACSAIPVRDPLSGRIEGILCFGFPHADADVGLDVVIRRAAAAIEHRLLEESTERERTLLEAYAAARRRFPAGAGRRDGRPPLALGPTDRVVLRERAVELLSADQRAAVDVALPGGRRVTLVSRPVTSATGVAGLVVEVVTPEGSEQLAVPADTRDARDAEAAPDAAPRRARTAARGSSRGPAAAADGDVVLVGEPGVGQYAVAARRRLELLSEASTRIGTTLDVARTARELAEMAVPRLADFVTIDLPEAVLRGEEPSDPARDLHRTVVHGIRDDCPFYPVGTRVELIPTTPLMRCLATRRTVLEPDLRTATGWIAQDRAGAQRILAHNVHSLIVVPLLARGIVLGIAAFYRARDPAPYGDDDRSLAQELATRAAICIDNARRYTREHAMVLALQRSLLPHGFPEQNAVEVAHRYMPAESGVGGDWFDVIPLSSTRVALVVGDVVGHGLHAAATMGRLRTAARNFAELDLEPDEVLTHLDNLVGRLDREECGEAREGLTGIIGATCLYVIYDPASQECAMARAGHCPPALVRPDGTVTFPDLPAGPPLGLGGLPFETARFPLPEGSQLVLYTDGLIEDRERDFDTALQQLRQALAHPGRAPEDTCRAVVEAVVPEHPEDDVALLVARTHSLDPHRVASWDVPADPAEVSSVRAAVTRQLAAWGLDEIGFSTELLLSELVTNAVRYGTEPIRVRLLYDRSLTCEVADGSSTSPHLRQAATTDEGGRGLFLVARLSQAWGTRYTAGGKVIWAECPLEVPPGKPGAEDAAPGPPDGPEAFGDLGPLGSFDDIPAI
ncbi:SpoIIE family protein phosphatase [Streptomyces mashuensis]|nr:SpoIIE family protein phosphatase [Streptomyces mashuensis]